MLLRTFSYIELTLGKNPTATPQLPHCYPTVSEHIKKIVETIADKTLSTKEIMNLIGLKDKSNLLELYLYPAIRQGLVTPLYPDKPKHPRQKYHLTENGKKLLKLKSDDK